MYLFLRSTDLVQILFIVVHFDFVEFTLFTLRIENGKKHDSECEKEKEQNGEWKWNEIPIANGIWLDNTADLNCFSDSFVNFQFEKSFKWTHINAIIWNVFLNFWIFWLFKWDSILSLHCTAWIFNRCWKSQKHTQTQTHTSFLNADGFALKITEFLRGSRTFFFFMQSPHADSMCNYNICRCKKLLCCFSWLVFYYDMIHTHNRFRTLGKFDAFNIRDF